MTMFLINLLLAFLWMLMWGEFDLYTLGAGLLVGYLLLGFFGRGLGYRYGTRGPRLISFCFYFIRIVIKSNIQVAIQVIRINPSLAPRIVRIPVRGMTPTQVTTLANIITLTPGTLSMDISDDAAYLYVHCLSARHRDTVIAELDEVKNRLMKEVFS